MVILVLLLLFYFIVFPVRLLICISTAFCTYCWYVNYGFVINAVVVIVVIIVVVVVLLPQGTQGQTFYIIRDGEAVVTQSTVAGMYGCASLSPPFSVHALMTAGPPLTPIKI